MEKLNTISFLLQICFEVHKISIGSFEYISNSFVSGSFLVLVLVGEGSLTNTVMQWVRELELGLEERDLLEALQINIAKKLTRI